MSTSARTASSASANAWASDADEGSSPFAAYQRRAASSSRSSAWTAAAIADRSGVMWRAPAIDRRGSTGGRSDARVDRDVLDDRVVLERVLGAVLAPAGLLDAAVRGLGRQREVLVDPDGPELELARDPHRLADRAREHRAREAELHVVRPLHGLLLVGEALDGDDGPEDLVLDDLGALVGVRDDRRLEVGAGAVRAAAAEHELGLRIEGPVDHPLHLVGLGLRDERE